jgi:integrase
MPRKSGKVPGYGRHKHSGQAVVRLDGVDHYLGPYGSDQSHELYERLITEWRAKRQEQSLLGPATPTDVRATGALTVEQLLGLYWNFAKAYYTRDGKPTKEVSGMKYAMRPLRKMYASLPARDFGPLALKSVRQSMVDADLCRNQVNSRVNRIKRIFKWAVSEELVPSSTYQALCTVTGLTYGRTNARETEPVRPVPDTWVETVLPFLSPQVATMIQLQRLTGMRPEEVVTLRMCEVNTSDEVWTYRPIAHKNRWRGHDRIIPIGPQAQRLLEPYLNRQPNCYLFSPLEAEALRNQARRQSRRTPMTPSHAARKAKVKPKRPKRDHYDVDAYRRAITYGIKKANKEGAIVPHWAPNQLRHSRGTEVRKRFGIEAAQVVLGHARADVTQVYAERDLELAIEVARQTG